MNTLSIIIPAYNEEKTIGTVLEKISALSLPGWNTQVIVVNDGSRDNTEGAVAPFRDSLVYVRHPINLGKGSAIRTALARVEGEAVLIQDADLEYHIEDIPALLGALEDGRVDAVYGSRSLSTRQHGYRHYVFGVWFLTKLVNLCFRSRLTDVYTCYKLVRAPILRTFDLQSRGFEYEMEITARLLSRGHRIREVPIRYTPRGFSEGKKIRAMDGIIGIATLVKNLVKNYFRR